jgi:hypothetical protein
MFAFASTTVVIPAKAGTSVVLPTETLMPASAGMTVNLEIGCV